MHLCLVTSKAFAIREGVGDYTFRLAVELAKQHEVTLVTRRGMSPPGEREGVRILPVVPNWGLQGLKVLARELLRLRPDVVNLQYEPYLYHRWGINLWLPLVMLVLRTRGLPIVTTVHEPFVPFTRWQWWLTGPIQRLSLVLLVCASRKIAVTTWAWIGLVRPWVFWRLNDVVRIPVGSNVPPVSVSTEEKKEIRRRWNVPTTGVVIGVFSPLGNGKLLDLVLRTWERLRLAQPDAVLMLLGVTRDEVLARFPQAPTGPRTIYTGFLAPDQVSRLIKAVDVALAPFIDGLSSRRSSTISLMAHGVPIVSTIGPLTDLDIFGDSPIRLVPVGEEAGFQRAIEGLLHSAEERERVGDLTKSFYTRHFAWGHIAKQVAQLAAAAAGCI